MSFPETISKKGIELKGARWLCPVSEEYAVQLLEKKPPPLPPFSEVVLNYLDDLYQELKNHPKKRVFPEISAFAFFCRRSNMLQLKSPYQPELGNCFGRGRVFHITPSNVPMNFAYSLVAALLAGNANVVRISSKEVEQVDIVLEAMNSVLLRTEHQELQPYIQILRYGREFVENTRILSALCDVRVIWGGDESIQEIRKSVIPPNAFDITFADRTSLAVMNAANLAEQNVGRLAQAFYNDTYLNDQNACTSPWLVAWIGEHAEVQIAQHEFWGELEKLVMERYTLNEISGVDKLATFMQQSIEMGDGLNLRDHRSNYIWRVHADEYVPELETHRCNSGYFLELELNDLSELLPKLSRNYQTLAFAGFEKEELHEVLREHPTHGIDRIVPIGRTQDFSLIWDGYDLIRSMSRRVI